MNKAIILVTGLAKAMWALQRISPAIIRHIMGRDLRKALKNRSNATINYDVTS